MINRINKGILYPVNPEIVKNISNEFINLPYKTPIPCCSWQYCFEELKHIFDKIGNCKPENIFVIGYLHKGKIKYDDPVKIYTNEDCHIEHPLLEKNDDVCSEEYCAEIILPFCDVYFPETCVNQFLFNDFETASEDFINYLTERYPSSLIFLSK